jgi:flagellar biosynthesis protein FlhF
MKIRRYLGNNTQEAILKVKMDLGNDALILNTRKVRQKGLLKVFAKPLVEVLAAIDENSSVKKEKEVQQHEQTGKKVVERIFSDDKVVLLESRVNNMESLLLNIYDQMNAIGKKGCEVVRENKQNHQSNVLHMLHSNLLKSEVDPDLAKQIVETVQSKVGEDASVNEAAAVMYNMISGMLGKPETIELRETGKPSVIICVGPTGVGKTTTLAKVAANYALNLRKEVGLITADTYRIAAVEQLKTYAEILGLPLKVIYSPNEIKDAIKDYSNKDIILIDTAGRSYKNKSQFEELKSLVAASEADEIFLVLSVTTSPSSCRDILNNYNFLNNYKLIFTKIDEACASGIILNARFISGKSLSYITTGQSVPDDIEVANIGKITKNLLGSIT